MSLIGTSTNPEPKRKPTYSIDRREDPKSTVSDKSKAPEQRIDDEDDEPPCDAEKKSESPNSISVETDTSSGAYTFEYGPGDPVPSASSNNHPP